MRVKGNSKLSKLALLGGTPIRKKIFPAHNYIGDEEKAAVAKVMDSGVLSRFIGAAHPDFLGGDTVRNFEAEWASYYQAKHAISVNSCTSGLYAAVGATGAGPGDEIIVSPYTMTASVTAAVVFNAVPIFADINPRTYCLDPDSVRSLITPRTKAIILVHLFGQVAHIDEIMEIAREHNLYVIEDCAQAPCGSYKGRPVGTLGHIGVFSLNYHKHIHSGEGGVITTNDPILAERMQLIRNHAEAVAGGRELETNVNMVGFNFRMGEIEAAIGLCQIRKATDLVSKRRANVAYLEQRLSDYPGLTMPEIDEGASHSYYMHVMRYDAEVTGVSREHFVEAIKAELPPSGLREAEGPLIGAGYVKPIYLHPMFATKTAFGNVSCPFDCPHYTGTVSYGPGLCPNCEDAHATVITHEFMRPSMSESDMDDVICAFGKVKDNFPALRRHDKKS
jgi:perosamine synthetase